MLSVSLRSFLVRVMLLSPLGRQVYPSGPLENRKQIPSHCFHLGNDSRYKDQLHTACRMDFLLYLGLKRGQQQHKGRRTIFLGLCSRILGQWTLKWLMPFNPLSSLGNLNLLNHRSFVLSAVSCTCYCCFSTPKHLLFPSPSSPAQTILTISCCFQ